MNAEQVAAVMARAVGEPSSGAVAEVIPVMAQAVAEALNPSEAATPEAPEAKGKADTKA